MIENRILCDVICIEIITNLNQIIMKLFSLFKKETSKEVKSNIQKMDKKQLEKVIGGADTKTVVGGGVVVVGTTTASGL